MALRSGDYIDDLVRYIENNLDSGYREDQLRFLLINQGYSRSAVEKAFRIVKQKGPKIAPQAHVEEAPKVEAVPYEEPSQKKGFFSRLFSIFSSKKSKKQAPESAESSQSSSSSGSGLPEKVRVDSNGNLIN